MSEEDEGSSGADDVWTDEFDDAEPDEFDEPKPDDFDWGPSNEGGGKGRLLIGLGLLLVGVVIALVAWTQSGDDGSDAATTTRPSSESADKPAKTTTTEAAPVTIVPTTIAGGVLPTGCGDWDPAFSFDPDPIEGVTIYSDFEGWHVVLAPDGPPVVTGTVVGQVTPFVSTEPPGPGVQLIADPNSATVTYRLTGGDEPVGFDFAADCAQKSLTFDLKDGDGQALDPSVVHLGRKGGTPTLPVVAQRTMAAS